MASESILVNTTPNDDFTNIECNEDIIENNIIVEQTHLMDCRSMESLERRKRYREEPDTNSNEWQTVSKRPGKKVRSQQNLEDEQLRDGDPAWSERMRRRRAFADAALELPLHPQSAAPVPSALCRHLLAALLSYAPPPQRPKISFSIESIIGVK